MLSAYQCLHKCGDILIAASISRLDSFSLEDGSRLSSWTYPTPGNGQKDKQTTLPRSEGNLNLLETQHSLMDAAHDNGPPAKRRKLSGSDDGQIVADGHFESKKIKQSDAVARRLEAPAFMALTSTKDGKHVIAVTGEDKSISVYEHDGRGQLHHISRR